MVPGAGFEPAKHYAEDLESTPFDRSGTPARMSRSMVFFLTIPLARCPPNPMVSAVGDDEIRRGESVQDGRPLLVERAGFAQRTAPYLRPTVRERRGSTWPLHPTSRRVHPLEYRPTGRAPEA